MRVLSLFLFASCSMPTSMAPPSKPPPVAPEPVTAASLNGTWNVSLKATYSTCYRTELLAGQLPVGGRKLPSDVRDVNEGDLLAQQWVVSVVGDSLMVNVLAAGDSSDVYLGSIEESGIRLESESFSTFVTIDLTGDAAILKGRRVVARSTPCAIIYDVTAKKQG